MATLINSKTSLAENIPQDKVGDAFLSGSHNFHATDKVPLLNPDGELVTVDAHEVYPSISQGGYKFPNQSDLTEGENDAKYGDGFANSAKAFGAGALRSATFGGSDLALTHSGLASPETLSELSKRHPVATFGGEAAGIVGALAAPELEGLNAVKGLSKVGSGVEHALAPAAEVGAQSAASRVLQRIGSKTAGSAVEGAAYGLGQSVSEHALGDPELNSEKVLSNVGYGALFGGAVGGALGIPSAFMGKEGASAGKFISGIDRASVEAGDLGAAVDASAQFTSEEKQGVLSGLAKRKENAADIEGAAARRGYPVVPGMLSDSEYVQKAASSLINGAPTWPAAKIQNIFTEGVARATSDAQSVLHTPETLTAAETGSAIRDSLAAKIDAFQKPIKELYDASRAMSGQVFMDPAVLEETQNAMRNIREVKLMPRAAASKLATDLADSLGNAKTVEDLQTIRNSFGKSMSAVASPEERRFAGILGDMMDELEEKSVMNHVASIQDPVVRMGFTDILQKKALADAAYKPFKEELRTLMKKLGKSNVKGARDAIQHIEGMSGEDIASKLFTKNDSAFIQKFNQSFPEEMELLRSLQKGKVMAAATKSGDFSANAAFKAVHGLSPEVQGHLFTPEELGKFKDAQLYLKELPKNANPSNTDNVRTFREYFSSDKDIFGIPFSGAIKANARDAAISKFLNHATADETTSAARVAALSRLERSAQKTTQAIASGAKRALITGSQAAGAIGAQIAPPNRSPADQKEDKEKRMRRFEKTQDELRMIAGVPEASLDKLSNSTRDLSTHAPDTTAALQQKGSAAVSFLHSKLPQPPNQKALSAKWEASQSDIAKFERYQRIVSKPTAALGQITDGTLTPETIETLTTVYPRMYQEMKGAITEELTNVKERPDYQRRLMLSMFLGQNVDDSLEPASIAANQQAFGASQQQPPQQAGGVKSSQKGMSSVSVADRALTSMQKTSQRS